MLIDLDGDGLPRPASESSTKGLTRKIRMGKHRQIVVLICCLHGGSVGCVVTAASIPSVGAIDPGGQIGDQKKSRPKIQNCPN